MRTTLTKLALGIIFVTACTATSGITDTNGRNANLIPFTPPAIYEAWWQEIADCEQLPLPADHTVQWYIVAVRPFVFATDTSHTALDAAIVESDSTVTKGYINYSGILDHGLITHEMTHVLLFKKFGTKYVGGHPDQYYTRCGLVPAGQQKLK